MVTLLDVVPPKDYSSFVDLYLVRGVRAPWFGMCGCGDARGAMK